MNAPMGAPPAFPPENTTPTAMSQAPVQFPEPLAILFTPKRYKVIWGGRGGTRSWSVARALLLIGAQRTIRVLCARELQKSISESVHKVLSDQIKLLGLSGLYRVEVNKIYGPEIRQPDGSVSQTEFSFEGIKNNSTKIKSYEGVDYCWVEEANKVSSKSWEDLIPTIRKTGSEIWITFNPELATDYTYKRFVRSPSGKFVRDVLNGVETTEAFVIKMSWRDNPWFYETELPAEMEDLKTRDYDAYLNVWEGHCRQALEGAVFAKELRDALAGGRICRVAWDRETPVDTFWDLGRRDMTAIWFAQRVAMQWRILGYFEDAGEDIHYYLRQCQAKAYTYGTFYLPHDARNKVLGAKRSIEQIVAAAGYRTRVVQRVNKKVNGINAARIIFPTCWFDEVECEIGIERLRHYRYAVVEGQRTSEEPLHDENSNGADAFMTLAQAMKSTQGVDRGLGGRLKPKRSPLVDSAPGLSWMAQ